LEDEEKKLQGLAAHLVNLNQPNEVDDDGDSLGSTEWFDPPAGPPPRKPLLAAALKAKQAREQAVEPQPHTTGDKTAELQSRKVSGTYVHEHLKQVNQPFEAASDDESLVFDDTLAATLKAKRQPDPAKSKQDETLAQETQDSKTQPRINMQSRSLPAAYEASLMSDDVSNPTSNKTQQTDNTSSISSSKARQTHPQQAASPSASTTLIAPKKRTGAVSSVQPLHTNASSTGARVVSSSKPRPVADETSMSFDDVFKPATLRAGNVHEQKKKATSFDASMSFDDVFKPLRVEHVHIHNGAQAWTPASQDAKKQSTGITSSEQKCPSAHDASMSMEDVFTPASSRIATPEKKSRSTAHTPSSIRTPQSGRIKADTPKGDHKETPSNASSETSLNFDDVFQQPAKSQSIPLPYANTANEKG
jgi:hypothetical protein